MSPDDVQPKYQRVHRLPSRAGVAPTPVRKAHPIKLNNNGLAADRRRQTYPERPLVTSLKLLLISSALFSALSALAQPPLKPKAPPDPRLRLLDSARSEPVEVEAYVFRKLLEKGPFLGPKESAHEERRIRERAISASSWLPELLANSNVEHGYFGAGLKSTIRMSGIEISLESLERDRSLDGKMVRRELEELPRPVGADATCDLPIVSSSFPLYRYAAKHGKELFRNRAEQVAFLVEEASRVHNAFDLKGWMDVAESFGFTEVSDVNVVGGQLSGLLSRTSVGGCASSTLIQMFDFGGGVAAAIKRLDSSGVSSAPVYSAYRGFITRTLASPVCKGEGQSSQETRARRRLRADYNLLVAGKTIAGASPVADDEVTRLEAGRAIVDLAPAEFSPPPALEKALLAAAAFAQAPPKTRDQTQAARDVLDDFFYGWRHWEPSGTDFRGFDSKAALMFGMVQWDIAGSRSKALQDLLPFLSNSRFKRERPAIWISYVTYLVAIANGGRDMGGHDPTDPSILDALSHSSDDTLRLFGDLERLQ